MSDIRKKMMNRLPSGSNWYTITNKAGPVASIRLYDEIGWFGVTEDAFADELAEITADKIEVQISSAGGDVFAGIAIYNALRSHPAHITTRVDSLAASIASVIVQAGDHRVMLSGSQQMIHPAWGMAIGSADEMRELADLLDKQTDIIAGIYAERSGKDAEHFRSLMDDSTWFTDEEAVEAGLADEVVKPPKKIEDKTDTRFSDHAASVVTEVEQLIARAEEVIAFRADQGKPPLSDEAIEAFERLEAARNRLAVALAPQPDIADEARREFARFIATTQGVAN